MRIAFLLVFLTASVFAQGRGGSGGVSVSRAPMGRSYSPAPRPAAPRPAAPRAPYVGRPYQPRAIVVPYPVFLGGGYYSDYAPNSGYADQTPVAVVNQDFRPDAVNPVIVDYSSLPLPAADDVDANALKDDQPTIFLIALTDHTVVAAIAYWVEDDTLNWVSRDAKQNRMSLSLVDRQFSQQLNDERHVEFKLPPPQ